MAGTLILVSVLVVLVVVWLIRMHRTETLLGYRIIKVLQVLKANMNHVKEDDLIRLLKQEGVNAQYGVLRITCERLVEAECISSLDEGPVRLYRLRICPADRWKECRLF